MARWILSLIRGSREPRPVLAGPSNPATARFVMQRYMQGVHRAIGFVDGLVDRAILVKPQQVQPLPAPIKEMQHRPDSVAERFGLLGRKALAFHADTVY